MSKKALAPGPDRVRAIVALYQACERKGAFTGGKSVISGKQLQDVADLLGADTPAWFQQRIAGNYGHHGFLDYQEAKQILTMIEALALKAQPADGSQGRQADQEQGRGVVAAPDQGAVAAVLAHLGEVLTDRIRLQERQLAQAKKDRPTSRKGHEYRDQVESWAVAEIALTRVILDSLPILTPDGWRMKAGADCPWCGERNMVAFPVKIDAEHEGLVDVDTLEKCTACGRGFQAQLVSYLSTSQSEGWE